MAKTVITSSFSLTAIPPASRVKTRQRLDAQREGAPLDPRLSQLREASWLAPANHRRETEENLKSLSFTQVIYRNSIKRLPFPWLSLLVLQVPALPFSFRECRILRPQFVSLYFLSSPLSLTSSFFTDLCPSHSVGSNKTNPTISYTIFAARFATDCTEVCMFCFRADCQGRRTGIFARQGMQKAVKLRIERLLELLQIFVN